MEMQDIRVKLAGELYDWCIDKRSERERCNVGCGGLRVMDKRVQSNYLRLIDAYDIIKLNKQPSLLIEDVAQEAYELLWVLDEEASPLERFEKRDINKLYDSARQHYIDVAEWFAMKMREKND